MHEAELRSIPACRPRGLWASLHLDRAAEPHLRRLSQSRHETATDGSSAYNESFSVGVTSNLKGRLSELTNKGTTHAVAAAKARFPRYHVDRVPAVF